MKHPSVLSTLGVLALLLAAGCNRSSNPAAEAAKEASASADARVAALERELADLKSGKLQPASADQEVASEVVQAQKKALEKQLADARRKAEVKKKEAQQLATAPAPKEAPKAVVVEVPSGTQVQVKLAQELATDKVQAGDAWEGTLAAPVSVNGRVVWAAGTPVRGVVTQSIAAGRLSTGKGGLGIRLTEVGKSDVDTGVHVVTGDARGARNAKFIGGGAALGALAGLLSDRKHKGDHALGGAAIGAAAGTAPAAASADTVIRIKTEQPVAFTLSAPEKVTLQP